MKYAKPVEILKNTLIFCQVCADGNMPVSEVAAIVNRENPTGIESDWTLTDKNLAGDNVGPIACGEDDTRRHYLFVC